jgi:hypothetical protein
MIGTTCLITGAEFLDPVSKRRIHGDLHQLMNILIFNSYGCHWESAEEKPLDANDRAVSCPVFYEAHGQIVFPLEACEFNLAANIYLNKQIEDDKKRGQMRVMIHDLHNPTGKKQ